MLVHRMARVRGNVHTEVACLRVQLLHVRGDAGVLCVRWHGVAVTETERHVLRTRNDVYGTRELVRGPHDRRLREEYALSCRLLRCPRQVERGRRKVREVEEVELVRLRLWQGSQQPMLREMEKETYETGDEVGVR